MRALYRALVELVEAKVATEQVKPVVILKDSGLTLVDGEDGPELALVESEVEEEGEPRLVGFTPNPKKDDDEPSK